MAKLRWERQSGEKEAWYAYSGEIVIGMVLERTDNSIMWKIDAVHTKYICKGYAYDVSSVENAKKALSRSWNKWCSVAGFNN